MCKKTYCFTSSIFNVGTEANQEIFRQRIAKAFDKENQSGKNFWKYFFSCEEYHADCERFVYYFTEEQLNILYKWWQKKSNLDEEKNEERRAVARNLVESVQTHLTKIDDNGDGISEKVFACYTNYKNRGGMVKKLTFHPNKKEDDNFFKGEFSNNFKYGPGEINNADGCLTYIKNIIEKREIRKRINRKVNTSINNGKWLFYNGLKYSDKEEIYYCRDYCEKNKINCPFI